jgi:hypothetical protein
VEDPNKDNKYVHVCRRAWSLFFLKEYENSPSIMESGSTGLQNRSLLNINRDFKEFKGKEVARHLDNESASS